MKHTKSYLKLKKNEAGVVSMIVVILIMLLLSLIVLTMSQNANRERRQALDRQLSEQALYNAESGINDTINYLYRQANNPSLAIEQLNNCEWFKSGVPAPPTGPPYFTNSIDSDGINKYTCLFYNKAPTTLEFSRVGVADSRTVNVEILNQAGNAPANVRSLTISWDDSDGDSTVSGCDFAVGAPDLPPQLPGGCGVGGVRADIISHTTNPASSLSQRDQLIQNTINIFSLPSASGVGARGIPAGGYPNNQGIVGQANCSDPAPNGQRQCKLKINGINARKFALHLRALYKPVDITVCASATAGADCDTTPVRFNNGQIMVDATGKANDVLRRIQVRLPSKPQVRQAEFGIHSMDTVCKLLSITGANQVSTDGRCPF